MEGDSEDQIRARLRSYREAGFDTVILRAFHLPGDRPHLIAADTIREGASGVYYQTSKVPVIYDLFEPFVRLCREENIRPFAWMVTRKAAFGNTSLPRDRIYITDEGKFRQTGDLDILDPLTWDYLEELFVDLAKTGVEGILLQDDLSSRMQEGFTESNIIRFMEETGAFEPPYEHLSMTTVDDGRKYLTAGKGFNKWIRWKTEILVNAARSLQEACTSAYPGTMLVMNQMYETVTDPENGRLWLSQDLRLSLKIGPAYSAVMLYHRQMQDELGMPLSDTLEMLYSSLEKLSGKIAARNRVILKFQTRDWKTGQLVPADDLISTMLTAWGGGWSVAFVPPPDEEQLRAIAEVLRGL